jgi:hypothetical protein
MLGIIFHSVLFTKDSATDLVLSDTFSDCDALAERVRTLGAFKNVYKVRIKNLIYATSPALKLKKIKFLLSFEKMLKRDFVSRPYDEFWFNNEIAFNYALISLLRSWNPACRIFRFEEGYATYTDAETVSPRSEALIRIRNFVLGNPSNLLPDTMYLFSPELLMFTPKCEVKKVSMFDLNKHPECIAKINTSFNYTGKSDLDAARVIFLEDCAFEDMGLNDDLDLVKTIADAVGRENIIVKLHPRTRVNRFEKLGIRISSLQCVPWEAVVMNMPGDSAKIFVTISSGSVMNYGVLIEKNFRTIMLYKLVKKEFVRMNGLRADFFERFVKAHPENLSVPESRDELLALLGSI